MTVFQGLLKFIIGDAQADRAVPPTGFTVRLTVFSSAAMAFLAVFALALSLAAGGLADKWGEDLARSSTVRISAPAGQMTAQTEAALNVLNTTTGVAAAHVLDLDEQRALLEPWFGTGLPLDQLPLPQLISIEETSGGYDAAGLRLRLSGEVPGAVLDDHGRWRAPLLSAASALRLLGWVSLLLIAMATGAMITLAANSALSANGQVIRVMRLVGARDGYIAQAFVRRFTLRSFFGALTGMVAGVIAMMLLPGADDGVLTKFGFSGGQWLLPLCIPVLAGLVAFLATQMAARSTLKDMP